MAPEYAISRLNCPPEDGIVAIFTGTVEMPDHSHIIHYLRKRDERLGQLIGEVGAFRLAKRRADLEFLVGVIISQQISKAAAETIITRLRALFPEGKITAGGILRTRDSRLRATGLSARKCDYIRDLAGRIRDNSLNLRKLSSEDDDTIRAELKQVKGIGDWTVDIFLMFALARLDIFPLKDLALRKAVAAAYGVAPDDVAAMLEIAENWRPYRSVASWYLFRFKDNYSL